MYRHVYHVYIYNYIYIYLFTDMYNMIYVYIYMHIRMRCFNMAQQLRDMIQHVQHDTTCETISQKLQNWHDTS